jgi:hypothetical protein
MPPRNSSPQPGMATIRKQDHLIPFWASNLHISPEVGMRNFFFSPQSQFHNLKEALPQSQFRNFLRNVAPQPQLRNSAIAIFSKVRNFKSATWNFHFRNFDIFLAVE